MIKATDICIALAASVLAFACGCVAAELSGARRAHAEAITREQTRIVASPSCDDAGEVGTGSATLAL